MSFLLGLGAYSTFAKFVNIIHLHVFFNSNVVKVFILCTDRCGMPKDMESSFSLSFLPLKFSVAAEQCLFLLHAKEHSESSKMPSSHLEKN